MPLLQSRAKVADTVGQTSGASPTLDIEGHVGGPAEREMFPPRNWAQVVDLAGRPS